MMTLDTCSSCGLSSSREKVKGKIVWGSGNLNSHILLIGEAPGGEGEKTGEPFRGRGGKYLRSELGKYIDVEKDMYITNTVLCRPPENRAPLKEEMEACFPHIQTIIMCMMPKIIITAGLNASWWLSNFTGVNYSNYLISIIRTKKEEIAWLPIYHPTYLLRNYEQRLIFQDIIKKKYSKIFKAIAKGTI